jgi:O-methyltransferase involved in polyketide biosynthesis
MLYQQTRVRSQLWQFGLDPQAIGALLADYGWQEMEQAGADEYQARYLKPVGRALPVMAVERIVLAGKTLSSNLPTQESERQSTHL